MKKLIILSVLCVATMQGFSQTGKNCFNTQFHKDATSLDPVNAYLLGYLCTMSYPDYFRSFFPGVKGYGLKGDSVKFLQSHNTVFVKYYSTKLGYLFVDKDQASGLTFASSAVATIDRPEINQLKPSLGSLATPAGRSSLRRASAGGATARRIPARRFRAAAAVLVRRDRA